MSVATMSMSMSINDNEPHIVSEYFDLSRDNTRCCQGESENIHDESPPISPPLPPSSSSSVAPPPMLRVYSDPTAPSPTSPDNDNISPPSSSPIYDITCHTTPSSPNSRYRGISLAPPSSIPITPIYESECTCADCLSYAAMTISSQAPSRHASPRQSRSASRSMSTRSSIVSTPTSLSPSQSRNSMSTTTTRSSISGSETPDALPDDFTDCIGPFKLGETLGKGQSGYVRVGRHVDTGFEAAFKIIDKSTLQNDPKQWHKIMREIVILKLMEHPHVLKLYDVLETKKNIYMVLEYVKGGELFQYIISKGRLDRNESLRLIAQLIQGLEHCHAYNISHRDLKPENLLLDEQKNIKIADFGMALLTKKGQLQRTRCGSPHYVSPEVIEGRMYDPKVSDVWSVGVIFYAMLTGCHPFDHENVAVLLSLITQGKYTVPFYVDPDVTDLLRRMLVVEPSKRIELSAIKHHAVFKKTKYFADPQPSPCAPPKAPAIIVSDVTTAHTLEEQLDENVLNDLEALGLGWGTREQLRQKIVAASALNGEPSIEKCFYDRLLARRASRRDELSRLSPRPMEPRIPHSPIPRTVRPANHLSLPGPINIPQSSRPPQHHRRPSNTNVTDMKPIIHVSIPIRTSASDPPSEFDDLDMDPSLPWHDGVLIIPPALHAATNHHQQIYQSMANHFAHHDSSHHQPHHQPHHHHTSSHYSFSPSASPHHHHPHPHMSHHHSHQHQHQPSSRNPHRNTVAVTPSPPHAISPPSQHMGHGGIPSSMPTSPRRHSITAALQHMNMKSHGHHHHQHHHQQHQHHQHHQQSSQQREDVSFSPFLSPFSSRPASPPSTPPPSPKARLRNLEAAVASLVTPSVQVTSPSSSSSDDTRDVPMLEQIRTISHARGERGSIKQTTKVKPPSSKPQPKSKSWFSSIFAVKPSLNIMSGQVPTRAQPLLGQTNEFVMNDNNEQMETSQ